MWLSNLLIWLRCLEHKSCVLVFKKCTFSPLYYTHFQFLMFSKSPLLVLHYNVSTMPTLGSYLLCCRWLDHCLGAISWLLSISWVIWVCTVFFHRELFGDWWDAVERFEWWHKWNERSTDHHGCGVARDAFFRISNWSSCIHWKQKESVVLLEKL